MVALLVVAIFLTTVTVDHFLHRAPTTERRSASSTANHVPIAA